MSTSREFKIATWVALLFYPILVAFGLSEYNQDKVYVFVIISMMMLCTSAILKAIESIGGK